MNKHVTFCVFIFVALLTQVHSNTFIGMLRFLANTEVKRSEISFNFLFGNKAHVKLILDAVCFVVKKQYSIAEAVMKKKVCGWDGNAYKTEQYFRNGYNLIKPYIDVDPMSQAAMIALTRRYFKCSDTVRLFKIAKGYFKVKNDFDKLFPAFVEAADVAVIKGWITEKNVKDVIYFIANVVESVEDSMPFKKTFEAMAKLPTQRKQQSIAIKVLLKIIRSISSNRELARPSTVSSASGIAKIEMYMRKQISTLGNEIDPQVLSELLQYYDRSTERITRMEWAKKNRAYYEKLLGRVTTTTKPPTYPPEMYDVPLDVEFMNKGIHY